MLRGRRRWHALLEVVLVEHGLAAGAGGDAARALHALRADALGARPGAQLLLQPRRAGGAVPRQPLVDAWVAAVQLLQMHATHSMQRPTVDGIHIFTTLGCIFLIIKKQFLNVSNIYFYN